LCLSNGNLSGKLIVLLLIFFIFIEFCNALNPVLIAPNRELQTRMVGMSLTACDIFSLGATIYEMVTKHSKDTDEVGWDNLRRIKHEAQLPHLAKFSVPFRSLLVLMLHQDPSKV
jgi:hypothetical protein